METIIKHVRYRPQKYVRIEKMPKMMEKHTIFLHLCVFEYGVLSMRTTSYHVGVLLTFDYSRDK